MYLVGSTRVHLVKNGEFIFAKIAGGFEKLENYILNNHRFHEIQLIKKMIQSKESIEWVVEALVKGTKIKADQSGLNDISVNTSLKYTQDAQIKRLPSFRMDHNGFINKE